MVYEDAYYKNTEITAPCPYPCWGVMYAFTNPNLEIIELTPEGKVIYETTLGEIRPPAPAQVWPTQAKKDANPLSNVTPRSESNVPVLIDKEYNYNWPRYTATDSIIQCALDHRKYSISFGHDQFAFESVAFGMEGGRIVGGIEIQSHHIKGYRAEETGILQALYKGYSNHDFYVMVGVVPKFVDQSNIGAFLYREFSTWDMLSEFTNSQIKIIAVDSDGRELKYLRLREIGKLWTQSVAMKSEELAKGMSHRSVGTLDLSNLERS